MASHMYSAFIDIESGPKSTTKHPTSSNLPEIALHSANPVELDEISGGANYSGRFGPQSSMETRTSAAQIPHKGRQTPSSPNDIYFSRHLGLGSHEPANIVQSWTNPSVNKWRVLSCCMMYFGNGMNDSAPGALIPYIETHYHINYAIVSLVFVSQAVGFIVAAFCTEVLKSRVGQAKSLVFSELLMVAAYAGLLGTPPYPVIVFLFFCIGWAIAINLALNNVFCANLARSTVILGAAHGAYGIGGTIGPIIATALVSHGFVWSRYYAIPLGICLLGAVSAGWSFSDFEQEEAVLEHSISNRAAFDESVSSKRKILAQSLKYTFTLIGALFTFAYQGAEVSISGWIISFLITVRHGDPAHVGYVTAGFWAGITLGRFTLAHAAARLGERRFVFGLGISAIAFQLLVWLVPNIIGDAIAVALVGYVLGPVAPCSMVMFMRLIPRSIQTTSVGFISSAGSSGGAVAPFLTGLMAQAVGTYVLHPVCITLFVVMLGCWWFLPAVEKRSE